MDKSVRTILTILIVLVILSSFSTAWFFLAKERIYTDYLSLENLFKTSVERLNRKLTASNRNNKSLAAKLEMVSRELESLERKNNSMASQYDSLLREKDELKREVARVQKGKFFLDKRVRSMESDEFMARLLKDKASLEVEVNGLKNMAGPKDMEVEKLRAQNTDLGMKIARLEKEAILLEGRLRDSGEVAEALSRDLLKEKDKASSKNFDIENLMNENRLLTAKLDQNEKVYGKAGRAIEENDDLRLRLAKLKEELEDKERVSERLLRSKDEELKRVSKELDIVAREKEDISMTLFALQKDLNTKDTEIAKLNRSLSDKFDTKKELKETSERINSLLSEREDMRLRMYALEKDLETKDKVKSSLLKGQAAGVKNFDNIIQENESLRSHIAKLEKDLKGQDRLRKKLVKMKAEELDEVSRKYSSLLNEREDLRIKLVKLEKYLNSKNIELGGLSSMLASNTDHSTPYRAEAYHTLKEVDLPPIVLQREGESSATSGITGARIASGSESRARVVTINREHKFVVIDIGQEYNVDVGDRFSVYRGDDIIGLVEVIQARKKIAACDIKDEKSGFTIESGDIVKKR
ncbi:MAG: hypothetical protein ABIG92_02625 [Candidatus Omnitrophota bacterium]